MSNLWKSKSWAGGSRERLLAELEKELKQKQGSGVDVTLLEGHIHQLKVGWGLACPVQPVSHFPSRSPRAA